MNTKNVKVTMKNSKQDMLRFLEAVLPTVKDKDKNLTDRVEYALDNSSSAKKSEVFEIVDEVQNFLLANTSEENTEVETPVENEVKKPSLKKKQKTVVETVEEAPVLSEKSMPLARVFPEVLNIEGLGTLKAVPETTMEELAKALTDEGRRFFFACYWTPRMIKEYEYSATREVGKVKSFQNDLDLLEPVYYCDGVSRMWACSVYTEAMFRFNADSMEHIVETNPYNGEKFRIRVSNGMEFEVYELTEDADSSK